MGSINPGLCYINLAILFTRLYFRELQLSDTILAQYGLVSGLWNMAFAIGDVLGPTLGGALIERFQFQNTAAFFAAVGVGLVSEFDDCSNC